MPDAHLDDLASHYLRTLCQGIPTRQTGTQGNRDATATFAREIAALGFEAECPEFDCFAWTAGEVHLTAGGEQLAASASPYSLGVQVQAPLSVASTVEQLAQLALSGRVLLARGDLVAEPLMPKSFPFYNPEHHQRIVRMLEAKQPAAIVAATGRNPEAVGALYPFPWIEDGDFDIPSVFMTDDEGDRLAPYAGQQVALTMEAARSPSTGCNVLGHRGGGGAGRFVVCAHIDCRMGSPGALDNASGVVVLLLLAHLLQGWDGALEVELLALNGHEYYSAAGGVQYVARNAGLFGDIVLAANLDAAGYAGGRTAFSLYECPDALAATIASAFAAHDGLIQGPRWFQSDHMIFVQNGRPAVAITSEDLLHVESHITHTADDVPELVDVGRLVEAAHALHDLAVALDAADM